MSIRSTILALVTVALVVTPTLTATPVSAGTPPGGAGPDGRGPALVRVESGWLRGSLDEEHVTFSSIPYAAPPVADRRWRAPERPHRWSGIREATAPSPLCPQRGEGPEAVVGQEDCLFLDVTVPRDTRESKDLPVLVWLHGGGLTTGGAQRYDASTLAAAGDMVVVTINYRLGALGFLATPELGRSSGNFGLLDQAAALRWVRRNIDEFGGDRRNVTLAGQSGGARSVCAHLASPFSRGLFDPAIMQSGACDNEVLTRDQAWDFGAHAIDALGCTAAADTRDCLHRQPIDKLVGVLEGAGLGLTERVRDRPWNPVTRTWVLPWQPADALRWGLANRVPLLLGSTRDEMGWFVAGWEPDLTEQEYRVRIEEAFGANATAVLTEYPAIEFESPAAALITVLTDWDGQIGACPVLRTAQSAAAHQPVYTYEFAENSGQSNQGIATGAYHGLDLPYLWELNGYNSYPELSPEQVGLSNTMIDYWSAFVHTADPNGADRPHWPQFADGGTVIEISTSSIGRTPFGRDHRCDFWAAIPD